MTYETATMLEHNLPNEEQKANIKDEMERD